MNTGKKRKNVTVAIYARKSKFTGKGESIENQIMKCREYIRLRADIEGEMEFIEYRDEGVSGKDMERPMMKKLLQDMERRKIQILVCYRLDRVSRSVKDFSDLIVRLTDFKVEFISVNEAFDTRTPMGRAMMYISSVFAQLERETIAERIADNMTALAKTGRWLGGKTPLGYISQQLEDVDGNDKKRSRYRLIEVSEEVELVKLIFEKYLQLGSLTKLETCLLNRNIHSRNGTPYGRYALRAILTNPVYCVADMEAYQYLEARSYGIYADKSLFDGRHGLIAYNKNNCRPKMQRVNDVKEWVVSVAEHQGIIGSKYWIQVQERINRNASLSYRYPKTVNALLSGMLRCKSCGSYMRPKGGRKAKDGQVRYYYKCECKERSCGQKCQMPNLMGNTVDELVVERIFSLKGKLLTDYSYLKEALNHMHMGRVSYGKPEQILLEKQLNDNEKQQEKLLDALGRSRNEATVNLILKRLDEVSEEKENLEKKLKKEQDEQIMKSYDCNCELLSKNLISLNKEAWELLSSNQQKDLLKSVIREIVWDGEYATIYLGIVGK